MGDIMGNIMGGITGGIMGCVIDGIICGIIGDIIGGIMDIIVAESEGDAAIGGGKGDIEFGIIMGGGGDCAIMGCIIIDVAGDGIMEVVIIVGEGIEWNLRGRLIDDGGDIAYSWIGGGGE